MKQQKITLAKQLLSELDILVEKWMEYFNQKNITQLRSDDITQSAMGNAYGIGSNFIDIKCIKEALIVLHLFFKNPQNPTLTTKIEFVNKEFDCLFDDFGDALDYIPEVINKIAYQVYHSYNQRDTLFVNLNQEKLNSYINSSKEVYKKLLLWEEEKNSSNPLKE